MVKADLTRDYYGDLELQPGASEADIKKQFKKLALKYHPDRNPGREAEVNAKFQTIQSAHEVLTDPQQRAKYDAGRVTSGRGYGQSSTSTGTSYPRGNPYANAGSYWPPPPKPPPVRKQQPTSAGAQRYSYFQTANGSAKREEEDAAEQRRKTYQAWERTRGDGKREQPARSWQPPKPVPKEYTPQSGRDESNSFRYPPPPKSSKPGFDAFRAGQSAQANAPRPEASRRQPPPIPKRNGFMPSTSGGDEPPAANTSAYFTRRSTRGAAAPPDPAVNAQSNADPLRQFREKTGTPVEPRLSTPYATHGGEKTDPFENIGLSRSKSTREPHNSDDTPRYDPYGRGRSASPSRHRRHPHNISPEPDATRAGSDSNLNSPKRTYAYAKRSARPTDASRTEARYTSNLPSDSSSSDGEDEDSAADLSSQPFAARPKAYPRRRNRRNPNAQAPDSSTETGGESSHDPLRPNTSHTPYASAQGGPSIFEPPDRGENAPSRSPSGINSSKIPVPIFRSSSKTPSSEAYSSKRIRIQDPGAGSFTLYQHDTARSSLSPSGVTQTSLDGLNHFENTQFQLLDELVKQRGASSVNPDRSASNLESKLPTHETKPSSCFTERARIRLSWLRPEVYSAMLKSRQIQALNESSKPSVSVIPGKSISSSFSELLKDKNDSGISSPHLPFDNVSSATNHVNEYSFGFNSADETFTTRSQPFTSSSAENINTKFTPEDWHGKFEAGEDYFGQDASTSRQARPSARARTRSPPKPRPMSRPQVRTHTQFANIDPETVEEIKNAERPTMTPGGTKFTPEEWAQTFKPQTFAPPPFPSPGTSARSPYPARPARRASRLGSTTNKPPSTSRTAGSAAMVDEDDSSDGKPLFMGPKGSVAAEPINLETGSPNAMDIDPPLPAQPPINEQAARNVPVEPSKPEWRAGDGGDAPSQEQTATSNPSETTKPSRRNTKSADAEDFKTNLEDLKNIEPLHQTASGLNSFNDLTSNLPFESKAASKTPLSKSFSTGQLDLPPPPRAPVLPSISPTAARPTPTSWESYLVAFKAYMAEYDNFNTKMIMHFVARKNQVDAFPPGWLEAFGDSSIEKYRIGLKEDQAIHEWWGVARTKHAQAVTDFQWMRDVMKDGLTQAGPKPMLKKSLFSS